MQIEKNGEGKDRKDMENVNDRDWPKRGGRGEGKKTERRRTPGEKHRESGSHSGTVMRGGAPQRLGRDVEEERRGEKLEPGSVRQPTGGASRQEGPPPLVWKEIAVREGGSREADLHIWLVKLFSFSSNLYMWESAT